MDRKDYEFTKRVGRDAYEQAIRDAVGEGGQPLPDVDQHRHPDYALIDHGHDDYLTNSGNQELTQTWKLKSNNKTFMTISDDETHIYHVADPENATHVANRNYVDLAKEGLEDRINALEHELDAIADTKEVGEWELVSILDFDVRGSGQMTLNTADFTASNNDMTLHETDKNGLSHGFSGVQAGDLVEVVEEHQERSTGDYGLYKVTGVNGMSFTLELQQGRGTADLNRNFFIKFFHLSEGIDIAELDGRYAQKSHTHNYASSSHTHNYASTRHTHSFSGGWVSLNHGKGTTVAPSESWSGSNGLHFHPFYWSGNRHYFGGKMNQTGLIEFRSGSPFYNKLGIAGTLIGSTNSNIVYPFIVFQVYYTSTTSADSGTQRCYGAPIYTRQPETSWSYIGDTIHWYWKGASR